MTEKRFVNHDDTILDNEGEQLISIDEIVTKLNELNSENQQLKKLLECSRQEANDYCEELMGKDEFIRLYKRINKELEQEIQQLKKEKERN